MDQENKKQEKKKYVESKMYNLHLLFIFNYVYMWYYNIFETQ